MMPHLDDRDLPVPDPDGSPIHPRELASAERRMLDEVEREDLPVTIAPNGVPDATRDEVERLNSREISEDDALNYRLAPDNLLDWLSDPVPAQDDVALERWENHLEWLELDERATHSNEDRSEPERDR